MWCVQYDMDKALIKPSDTITDYVSDVRRHLSGREHVPHTTDLRLAKHRMRNASRAKVDDESDLLSLNSLRAHQLGNHVTPSPSGNSHLSLSPSDSSVKSRYKRHHSASELHQPKLSSIIECDEDAVDGVAADVPVACNSHVPLAGGERNSGLTSSVLLAADRAILLAREDLTTGYPRRRDVRDKPLPFPNGLTQVDACTATVHRLQHGYCCDLCRTSYFDPVLSMIAVCSARFTTCSVSNPPINY